jgi:hypothetical protein
LAFWFTGSFFVFFGLRGGVVKWPFFEFFGVVVGVEKARPPSHTRVGDNTRGTAARLFGDPSSLEQHWISNGKTSWAGGVRHATPAAGLGLPCATGRFGMGICCTILEVRRKGDMVKVARPPSSSGEPQNRGNE